MKEDDATVYAAVRVLAHIFWYISMLRSAKHVTVPGSVQTPNNHRLYSSRFYVLAALS
jgi:hypothetical protein